GALGYPKARLDAHAGGREGAIGRGGRADHQVDVDGVNAGAYERLMGGGNAEVGGELTLFGDVALLDPRPLADPSVTGDAHVRKIVIGHDALGQVGADTANHRANECHFLPLAQPARTPPAAITKICVPARARPAFRAMPPDPKPAARA